MIQVQKPREQKDGLGKKGATTTGPAYITHFILMLSTRISSQVAYLLVKSKHLINTPEMISGISYL